MDERPVDLSAFEGKQMPPFLRTILGGAGGDQHELMKLAAWRWLKHGADACELVDFETGGFDVLGIRIHPSDRFNPKDPLKQLRNRIVIDAKASMSDVHAHFRKTQIPHCDIDGKFSAHANLHYIMASEGVVRSSAVQEPWGLLEYKAGMVHETKPAQERLYIGGIPDKDVWNCAKRLDDILEVIIEAPRFPEILTKRIVPEVFHKEEIAAEEIRKRHEELTKGIKIFEYMYGYNPLGKDVILR